MDDKIIFINDDPAMVLAYIMGRLHSDKTIRWIYYNKTTKEYEVSI